MNLRLFWLIFFIALLPPDPALAAPACTAQLLTVSATRATPDIADPQAAAQLGGWQTVTLPDQWIGRWPDYSGQVWYRIEWQRACPAGVKPGPVALTANSFALAGEVFSNNDLLWRDKSLVEPLSRSWNMPRYWVLPESSLGSGRNTLWIRIAGLVSQTPGLGQVGLGDPASQLDHHETQWWRQRTLLGMTLVVTIVLASLFSCIWLLHRAEHAYGWYALEVICWGFFNAAILTQSPWPFATTLGFERAADLVFIAFVISFCMFLLRFSDRHLPHLEKTLWATTLLLAVFALVTPAAYIVTYSTVCGLASIAMLFGVCVLFIVDALRTRVTSRLILSATIFISVLAGAHDLLALERMIDEGPIFIPYSNLVMLLTMSLLLGQRVAASTRRMAHFNQELQDSIARACNDLSTTLSQEHDLAINRSREQERLQMVRDIHDGLGGALVRSIASVEHASSQLRKDQVLSLLKMMRDDLRQLIDAGAGASTRVADSPALWLAPLRQRFGNLFDELDVISEWHTASSWTQRPETAACMALTRVLEESLTNIIKHSRARRVVIRQSQTEDGTLMLQISDDGAGFDIPSVMAAGLGVGLRSMQTRMLRLGGDLKIHSEPGHTELEASLPACTGDTPRPVILHKHSA